VKSIFCMEVDVTVRNSDVNKLLEELRKLVLTEEGLKQVTEVLLNWIMQKETQR